MDRLYNGLGGALRLLRLAMPRILVVGNNERDITPVAASVAGLSHFVTSAWDINSLANAVANGSPEIVVVDVRAGDGGIPHCKDLIVMYDQVAEAPRLAVVGSTDIGELQSKYVDDFILYPYETSELALRIIRLLSKHQSAKSGNQISMDGLTIDTDSFEVSVDGRQLALTFKEFELLRFLAAHLPSPYKGSPAEPGLGV